MIFLDHEAKRKRKFRIIALFLSAFFLMWSLDVAITIASTKPHRQHDQHTFAFKGRHSAREIPAPYEVSLANRANELTTPNTEKFDFIGAKYSVLENDKVIALTFDDGPDPEHTRTILSTLRQYNVPATFFMLGKSVAEHPELAREIVDAGFQIGNHSYTHSKNVHRSKKRIEWELKTTDRIIEAITGRRTRLYRAPYLLDMRPPRDSAMPSEEMSYVLELGYIPIGVDLNPHDYERDTAEEVVEEFYKHVQSGNIALFHDNTETGGIAAEALAILIPQLLDQGYTFVPVSELYNMTPEEAMPKSNTALAKIQNWTLSGYTVFLANAGSFFIILTITIIALTILRLLFMLIGKVLFIRMHRTMRTNNWSERMTVLIPAYNEEENIAATIESVMANTYKPREILIIDDGSTDNTEVVARKMQNKYPLQVSVISKENGGKASALNLGMSIARYEIVVCIDADTVLEAHALRRLIRHFKDAEVACVAGKVVAVPSESLLSKFQELEYIIGQNIEKEAQASFNAVGVVPGAIGAWRRKDVLNAGGYGTNTLVEDQDITLALLQCGKKILYDPDAIAYTETPSSLKDLFKQRIRWVFGTIQCFWKYKANLTYTYNPSMRWIVLPNIAIFATFVPIISPLMDLILVLGLFTGNWELALISYGIFTVADIAYASIGLTKEKNRLQLFSILPLQRIFYRQLFFFIVGMSIIKAIEGTHALWNKAQRKGHAQKFFSSLFPNSDINNSPLE